MGEQDIKKLFLFLAVFALFTSGIAATLPAFADDDDEDDDNGEKTICSGFIGSGTFKKIEVKSGDACELDSVTVKGKIKVEKGGSLTISSSTVKGNIDAKDATTVSIQHTTVDGNIKINRTE